MEMRAEVGSLTRNIVIQGNADSDTTLFGAHTMFHSGSYIQLKGIEVTRAGQQGVLGRYPIHFHMFGDASGMVVEDCSIHNNYQRCFTFHGVHNLKAVRNVAYKTYGHCFFLEDAIETGNLIAWNLAIHTYALPETILEGIRSDDTPALFWITNPSNDFIYNSGASSPSHCMWIAPPRFTTGPSHTTDVLPRNSPLGRFEHNTVHGCGDDCFHADQGPNVCCGVPGGDDAVSSVTGTKADGSSATHSIGTGYLPFTTGRRSEIFDASRKNATYDSLTVYKCGTHGVWTRGGPHIFRHYHVAGARIGLTQAVGYMSTVEDSIFIGELVPGRYATYPIRGYEFYDGPNRLHNTKFYKYVASGTREASAISMLREDAFTIHVTNHARHIELGDNSNILFYPDLMHDGDKGAVFLDLDGSVTGRPPQNYNKVAVVNGLPFHRTPGCIDGPTGSRALFCPNHFVAFRFEQSNVASYRSAAEAASMQGNWRLTRKDKVNSPLYLCGGACNGGTETLNPRANSAFGNIPLYRDYYFHWMGPAVARVVDVFILGQAHSALENGNAPYNEMRIGFCYPLNSVVGTVQWGWKSPVTEATSFDDMVSRPFNDNWATKGNGMWYHDRTTGYVWVRLMFARSQVTQPLEENGSFNCAMPGVAEQADTHRVLPSIGTVAPFPATSPKVAGIPRDEVSSCPVGPSPAPVNCVTSQWSTWSACSNPCGGGTRTRSRSITTQPLNGGAACPSLTDSQACNQQSCDSNCVVSNWGSWGACSVSCGGGQRTRTRTITTPATGAGTCPTLSESGSCNTQACGADCVVSNWGSWTQCSATCGGGTRSRSRTITTQPSGSGAACPALTQDGACNTQACADCVVSQWGSWGSCSVTCGGGTRTRSRTITTAPTGSGAQCPSLTDSSTCNSQACAVDCVVSNWGNWGTCSATCGGGTRSRTRSVTTQPAGSGAACPILTESGSCNSITCPVNCVVSPWSVWSACSVNCGGGQIERTRTITTHPAGTGSACPALREAQTCNSHTCTTDCAVSEWSQWTQCSATCNGGERTRSRTVTTQATSGGAACPSLTATSPCNTQPCPQDCTVSEWSAWSTCSRTCGSGDRSRTRTVINAAANGGSPCPELTSNSLCNTQSCPIDCVMSDWSEWGTCSVDCGGGQRSRSRNILTPAAHGGSACGAATASESCNTQTCIENIDCVTSQWTAWGSCDASCGGGQQSRTRAVVTAASGSGARCPSLTDTRDCNTQACENGAPIDCVVSSWSDYGQCSLECGGGVRTRSREVITPAANGGALCGSLSEESNCNTQSCDMDCIQTSWSDWSVCSVNCGLDGVRTRVRRVEVAATGEGERCGPNSESQPCNNGPCAEARDCTWSEWGTFSDCSLRCNGGITQRSRTRLTEAVNGGLDCIGSVIEIYSCNSQPCTVFDVPEPSPNSPRPTQKGKDDKLNDNVINQDAGGIPLWAWIVIGAGVLVVVAVVILVVILVKRATASPWDKF